MADMLEQGYGVWTPIDIQFYTPTLSIFMDADEHEDKLERIVIPASTTLTATAADGTVFTSSTWLPKGTVMGQISASSKWIPWSSGASDGSQSIAAILAEGTTIGSSDVTTYAYVRGRFNYHALTSMQTITPPVDGNSHQLIIELGATV